MDFYNLYDGYCGVRRSENTKDEWTIAKSRLQTSQTRGENQLQPLQQQSHHQSQNLGQGCHREDLQHQGPCVSVQVEMETTEEIEVKL